MEVNDLLADSGADGVDDRDRVSQLGQSQNDASRPYAGTDAEFVPDSSNVPLFSHSVSTVQPEAHHTDVETALTDGNPDIFMYMALCIAVTVMVSAFCAQVLKK